ncbi:DUF2188 domain-containing protein [Pseudomonas sp. LS44]|uniref:DUF2188 domain-containing protein n=1 Tax=Pseudomonas sp. LS44 TaxID=1357074 RepID=UPI00215A1306|nr:DUF2188 domain-containing protein [Pseudomonas sp. LS44]UVE16418.1 DUF2188 domain-containing protein [Pseudomonas sp. LS44]
MSSYHVQPTATGWELRKEGATRPSKIAEDKQLILELTERFMRSRAGTVKVHAEDGDLEREQAYP